MRGARADAERWLSEYLEAMGRTASATVKQAAGRAGHAERTLRRAAKSLAVVVEYEGRPPVTYWSRPPAPPAPT